MAYDTPLTAFPLFKNLVQMVSSSDENWPMVQQNLQRARGKWGQLASILVSEEADRRTAGKFYVVVVQVVLIFRSKTWVLTPLLEKSLKGFHHLVVRLMVGMDPKR